MQQPEPYNATKSKCKHEHTQARVRARWEGEGTATHLVLRHVQQLLVVLDALARGPTDERRDGPPLRRVQLREVQQLLLLLPRPLRLLDAGVEPLVPASLALYTARQAMHYDEMNTKREEKVFVRVCETVNE
jgi:hypothetical protein